MRPVKETQTPEDTDTTGIAPQQKRSGVVSKWTVLLGAVTIGLVGSVAQLILNLPTEKGTSLLRDAALIWGTNILVFALWYWEIDCGGPQKRHLSGHKAIDFMFPQQADGNTTGWVAHFVDYLFLAFTGATAFI